jgi:DNA polymerase
MRSVLAARWEIEPMKLYADFETRSVADLKKIGAHKYAAHLSTDVLCLGFAFDDEPVEVISRHQGQRRQLKRIVDHVKAGGTFVAHNAAFEFVIWNKVCVERWGWPPLHLEQIDCTMARAYAMALPGALEKAAAAMGLSMQKDMAGNRVMLQLSQPRSFTPNRCPECKGAGCSECLGTGGLIIWWDIREVPEKYEHLYNYCGQDVEVERALDKRLLPLSPPEKALWILDQKINERGIGVDVRAARTAIQIVEAEAKRLDEEIRQVTGNQVSTYRAHIQLKTWINDRGVQTEGVAKNDVIRLLARSDLPPVVRCALLLRQEAAKSSTAKLEALVNRADSDQRMRGTLQYHGASTGRWAGRGFQPHNLPRPKLKQADIDSVFQILEGARV